MHDFKPYKALASINSASASAALELFGSCSGSAAWARRMADARPFVMLEDLYRAAEAAWFAVAATGRPGDLDSYTSVERRIDTMLESLGPVTVRAESGR